MSKLSKVKDDIGRMSIQPKQRKDTTMNQPVNTQFEELKKRVERLEQQQTEPIKVTIERRQTDAERMLDLHTEMLREHSGKLDMHTQAFQKIADMLDVQNEAISALQADVISIRATQSDHGELLKSLKATQDEHSSLLKQILAKLP